MSAEDLFLQACLRGDVVTCSQQVTALSDINIRSLQGASGVMLATMCRSVKVVRLLIAHKADPTITLNHNLSALHVACLYGYEDLVIALLQNDECNARSVVNQAGGSIPYTCLLAAASANSPDIVALLQFYGADVNQKFRDTQTTALLVALCDEDLNAAVLLTEAGARFDVPDVNGLTANLYLELKGEDNAFVKKFRRKTNLINLI